MNNFVHPIVSDAIGNAPPLPPSDNNIATLSEHRLRAVSGANFLARQFANRKMIVEPVIPEQSISMIYAQRGVGKTNVALTLAMALASGQSLFGGRWKVVEAVKVLYIDGEMPATTLQERLTKIAKSFGSIADFNHLQIITPDVQPLDVFMPNLASEEGQAAIEPFLDGVSLVIIDNISCLCRGGRENDAESWIPLQAWSLGLRKRNISVLFVHHSNKMGGQRGSNRKEDVMDTVIVLKQPKNYKPSDGVRCEVHYEKARGFYGEQARPFEIAMNDVGDGIVWTAKDIVDGRANTVLELHATGLSQNKIAKQTGINVSIVNRIIKEHRASDYTAAEAVNDNFNEMENTND